MTMKISVPLNSPLRKPDFIYGVATASFQVEGGRDHRLPCIWDTFCGQPKTIADGSNGDEACDHYHRWQEDLDIIKSLNVDAYRLSISWSRVMHSDGSLNTEGVDFYIAILDRLNANKIKPFVTLYHWDLPQHLEDNGGWLNRKTAYRFRDYVDLITQAFGSRVYSYATLNEPFCSAYLGYEIGIHAPGKVGKQYGKKAAHHLLLAHGLAMPVIEKNSPHSKNGIVLNFSPCYPKTASAEDQAAANLADEHFNHWYIKPLIDGCYPDLLNDLPESDKPEIQPGDMKIIAQPLDFVGVNYYSRAIYRADAKESFVQEVPEDAPKTDMGWEIYPEGLTDLLVSMNARYTLPPVYITENGAAIKDDCIKGVVNDVERISYFNEHLNAVHLATELGVNVQAYFAWSLMDNFEWAEGYLKRFGIVHVDYDTQVRSIKASGYAYSELLSSRFADT